MNTLSRSQTLGAIWLRQMTKKGHDKVEISMTLDENGWTTPLKPLAFFYFPFLAKWNFTWKLSKILDLQRRGNDLENIFRAPTLWIYFLSS